MQTQFFVGNREALSKELNGGIFVLSAYTAMQRGGDASFAFEQESNFWYLTGIESPDWRLIIDGVRSKSWLVAPPISDTHQVFDGSLSPEEAKEISGVDYVVGLTEGLDVINDLARRHSVAYTLGEAPDAEYYNFHVNPAGKAVWQRLERIFKNVQDCRQELSQLRAIKQPAEITAIKHAVSLTIDAFESTKEKLPELTHEYEVEAEFSYRFRRAGARGHAYDPIVASGKNACTLHYNSNQSRLKKGSLVLLDIGARYNGYAADITRTYAYGEPAKYQQSIHGVLEEAHHEIIKILQPDLAVRDYYESVDEIMKTALIKLGLISNMNDDTAYRRYFPHSISHGLGVDVHDPLGRPQTFRPGMLLTVEPGIYIPEKSIGIRIEDDILITEKGRENLSRRLSTAL